MSAAANPFSPAQELRFARVAARVARKLSRNAQQEVFATAYIRARESYGDFDETRGDGTIESRLDTWFYGLCLNAKKKIRREHQLQGAEQILDVLESSENPEAEAGCAEMLEQLSAEDLAIIEALRDGASVRQAARKCRVPVNRVKHVKRRLRSRLQTNEPVATQSQRESTAVSDDDMRELAPIDHKIEQLLRRPATEKSDCPTCWRCAWFDKLVPVVYQPRRFADPDIAEAALRIDLRKIEIGNGQSPSNEPDHEQPETKEFHRIRRAFRRQPNRQEQAA